MVTSEILDKRLLATARDAAAYRQAFGITAPIPSSASSVNQWKIDKDTRVPYFMAKLKGSNVPLDGNGTTPLRTDNTYIDYFPSFNLRYQLRDSLYLRTAASRTVTRPNFDQLSPSLTLGDFQECVSHWRGADGMRCKAPALQVPIRPAGGCWG